MAGPKPVSPQHAGDDGALILLSSPAEAVTNLAKEAESHRNAQINTTPANDPAQLSQEALTRQSNLAQTIQDQQANFHRSITQSSRDIQELFEYLNKIAADDPVQCEDLIDRKAVQDVVSLLTTEFEKLRTLAQGSQSSMEMFLGEHKAILQRQVDEGIQTKFTRLQDDFLALQERLVTEYKAVVSKENGALRQLLIEKTQKLEHSTNQLSTIKIEHGRSLGELASLRQNESVTKGELERSRALEKSLQDELSKVKKMQETLIQQAVQQTGQRYEAELAKKAEALAASQKSSQHYALQLVKIQVSKLELERRLNAMSTSANDKTKECKQLAEQLEKSDHLLDEANKAHDRLEKELEENMKKSQQMLAQAEQKTRDLAKQNTKLNAMLKESKEQLAESQAGTKGNDLVSQLASTKADLAKVVKERKDAELRTVSIILKFKKKEVELRNLAAEFGKFKMEHSEVVERTEPKAMESRKKFGTRAKVEVQKSETTLVNPAEHPKTYNGIKTSNAETDNTEATGADKAIAAESTAAEPTAAESDKLVHMTANRVEAPGPLVTQLASAPNKSIHYERVARPLDNMGFNHHPGGTTHLQRGTMGTSEANKAQQTEKIENTQPDLSTTGSKWATGDEPVVPATRKWNPHPNFV